MTEPDGNGCRINEKISNPKLVSAIEGLSNNNATQQKFFEELAQAKLLCPAEIKQM